MRKRRPISISKEILLENEDGRAYYHTWEERIQETVSISLYVCQKKYSRS